MRSISILFLLFTCQVQAQIMWQINKDTIVKWYYMEGDEFNGTTIDENVWLPSYGWSRSIWGNKEQQYYTDWKNHVVSNGSLKLFALRKDTVAKIVDWMGDNDTIKNGNQINGLNKRKFLFTSGLIRSKKEYQYGYFEIRFKIPEEKGYWPAFWLYGGNPNEEIDMMELKTEKKNQIHIDTHCPNKCDVIKKFLKKQSWGGWVKTNGDMTKDYNVIAGEWDKDQVKFYLNGRFIGISKVNFAIPKHIAVNIAVPDNNGPFHPGPSAKSSGSGNMEVDYVRVWTKDPVKKKLWIENQNESRKTNATKPMKTANSTSLTKNKYIYGNKKERKNDGITLSLFNVDKNSYQINILGEKGPSKVELIILENNQIEKKKIELTQTHQLIDFSDIGPGNYQLKFVWAKQQVQQSITVYK